MHSFRCSTSLLSRQLPEPRIPASRTSDRSAARSSPSLVAATKGSLDCSRLHRLRMDRRRRSLGSRRQRTCSVPPSQPEQARVNSVYSAAPWRSAWVWTSKLRPCPLFQFSYSRRRTGRSADHHPAPIACTRDRSETWEFNSLDGNEKDSLIAEYHEIANVSCEHGGRAGCAKRYWRPSGKSAASFFDTPCLAGCMFKLPSLGDVC